MTAHGGVPDGTSTGGCRLVSPPICCLLSCGPLKRSHSAPRHRFASPAPRSRSRRCWPASCARNPPPADPIVDKGKALYAKYCATCHGAAGNGYVADNAPSLRTPTFLATATDAFLQAAITRGRPGTAMGGLRAGARRPARARRRERRSIAFLRDGGPPLDRARRRRRSPATRRGQAGLRRTCARAATARRPSASSAVHLANPILLETAQRRLPSPRRRGRAPADVDGAVEGARSTPKQIDDVVAYVRSMATRPARPRRRLRRPAPPAAPRTGPIVLNPRGRAPDFTLKDNLYVSIDEVKEALDEKRRLVIADARRPAEWSSLHITGAISTPYYDPKALDDIPNDGTWVLAYCACPHHVSGEVVEDLRKRGYKHTAVIDEGDLRLAAEGLPGRRRARPAGDPGAAAHRCAAAHRGASAPGRRAGAPGRRHALNDCCFCPSCRATDQRSPCGCPRAARFEQGWF